MTDLQLNMLHPEALALYRVLSAAQELEGITLMGGTALALQIGHRFSLDFDFATFEEKLPTRKIDALVSRLKFADHEVSLITDPATISQFKINTGKDLLQYARDYTMNGVKVTFTVHGRTKQQRAYFSRAVKIRTAGRYFDILGLDAMKTAKTLVLADRVRARDLFDLMVLMRSYDYSVAEAMKIVESLGHNDDPEYYKAVMIGSIPLDQEDEGLDAINVKVTPDEMYAFFDKRIADYELKLAADYFSGKS